MTMRPVELSGLLNVHPIAKNQVKVADPDKGLFYLTYSYRRKSYFAQIDRIPVSFIHAAVFDRPV